MSQVDDIKAEFETIANAQVGIETFKYDYPSAKNVFADVPYPVLMLHTITEAAFTPQKKGYKNYNIVFGVYSEYLEAEKDSTERSVKQAKLETLGDHFLIEFDARAQDQTAGNWFRLVGAAEVLPTTEWIENMGDARVYAYEISFILQVPSECTTGTFNY